MSSTAEKIVASAAGELQELGLFAASLEGVRRRAGVSTGSAYHHFPGGMAAVSAEVYRSTLLEYQRDAVAVLDAAATAEDGVRAGVAHLLRWVEADPARARLLYQLEGAVDPRILDGSPQPLGDAIAAWIERYGRPEAAARRAELLALWIGPAKEYGRAWIRDPALPAPSEVAQRFAEAAWRCVQPLVRGEDR
jgi:AcrR family transcriptional regulator